MTKNILEFPRIHDAQTGAPPENKARLGEIIKSISYLAGPNTLRLANPELASMRVAAKLKARGIL